MHIKNFVLKILCVLIIIIFLIVILLKLFNLNDLVGISSDTCANIICALVVVSLIGILIYDCKQNNK